MSSSKIAVADVGLDSRMAGAEAVYSYRANESTQLGEAYVVPLGPRRTVGYVIALRYVSESELGFSISQLRSLGERVSGIDLPISSVELVHEVSQQTLTSLPLCLGPAIPPGLKDRLVTHWERTEMESQPDLSAAMQETLRVIEESPIVESKKKPVHRGTAATLRALQKRGLVKQSPFVQPFSERSQVTGLLRLTPDRAQVEKFLSNQGKKKPAQAVTLMRLQGSEDASFSPQEIKALGQVSDATIKSLVTAGLLVQVEEDENEAFVAPQPNLHQQSAIDSISDSITSNQNETFLLYGITGSGKTEVYLRCAEAALRAGRQVLYLVPEIALTAQVVAQLRARFGHRVAVMHSNLSPSERMENWMRVRAGEAPVVLGARSALFAPISNLGLIVMDEEHEASYKQESTPRYSSRRVAEWLANRFSCPLVLGSATPSIETFYHAESGTVKMLELPQRAAAKSKLPEVFIEDLREIYKTQKATIFAPRLTEYLHETISRGEQAILFLNRRAYAPFIVCRDCGHRFECPRCSVSLSLHRHEKSLRCHHCDHKEPAPEICPECDGDRVGAFGVGAEKVEEKVKSMFPGATVLRLDRDIVRRKGALEEVMAQFRSGSANVLVGTQMVAKGLDFPNVTLVGVIAADISLNVPDFRASERTFQLLTQVAGRAGRGERPGRVVIQTLSPDHPSVVASQTHNYRALYDALVQERRGASYPPFVRLVNVMVVGQDRHEVFEVSAVLGQRLRSELSGAFVLGPVNCALERLNSYWRRHIVLKISEDFPLEQIQAVVASVATGKARAMVDVDAGNMG